MIGGDVSELERVADVLGLRRTRRRALRTWSDLDRLVRAGLPKRSLQLVARRALGPGAPLKAFVYSVVPPATFKRRVKLSAEESARTERIARVVALAEALWGKRDEARAFLNRPHPLLDDETPLAVARTEIGARRIEDLLNDVQHGLPL
jgi:putative toxin-antitoxin system antitoxin component (TIGR02293 family)